MAKDILNNIFSVSSQSFTDVALNLFNQQYLHNQLYKQWVDFLRVKPAEVKQITEIPFLPISFFKSHKVITGNVSTNIIFTSSGTTQAQVSKHYVHDEDLYRNSFRSAFQQYYGAINDWCIIGLLPSYLERSGSSLVYMVDDLIKLSTHPGSGFYLHDFEALHSTLVQLEQEKQATLLIGVTFALLDFGEKYSMPLQSTTILETGGMKGRRKEMVREEVHSILQQQFGVSNIHSEYGMTEMLSQAYSKGAGKFEAPAWMSILVRDEDDPLHVTPGGRGLINVIDLANIHSCAFIATDDAGIVHNDGSFEVIGRMDNSDVRGCSLLVM